jgi:hypothetical protein
LEIFIITNDGSDHREQETEAARLAREIEGQRSSNVHINIERGFEDEVDYPVTAISACTKLMFLLCVLMLHPLRGTLSNSHSVICAGS